METPPQTTSTPTASHEDTEQALEQLDQAKPAAAGIPLVITSTEDTIAGNLQAVSDLAGRSWPSMAAAQADSPPNTASQATQPNTPSKPQDDASTPAAATTAQSTGEMGNAPGVPPAARDGPEPVKEWPRITLARGQDGRLYNPAKGEPASKSASVALLKPLVATTYDDSTSGSLPRERGIKGLSDIPKDWPKLPPNVSLGVEVSWVQANRLAVVKELPSGAVKVDLAKAYAPAPSMSTLFWLETAIKNPAKFVEVASKQASSGQDEAEFVRKERMAIGEIDALLAEMYDAEGG